jgi:hypothetical protein
LEARTIRTYAVAAVVSLLGVALLIVAFLVSDPNMQQWM